MENKINRREFLKLLGAGFAAALTPAPVLALSKKFAERAADSGQKGQQSPNFMILVFDALSATNMSLYGYPRQTTPNIDRIARKATVYHRHYAAGNFTSSGTASLLTGLYPWTHRAFNLYGTVVPSFVDNNIFHSLPAESYKRIAFTHNELAAMLLHQFRNDIDIRKKTNEVLLFNENFLADRFFENDANAAFLGERMIVRGQRGQDVQLPTSLLLSTVHHFWRNNQKSEVNSAYKETFPRRLPSTNAEPYLYLLEDAIDWIQDQITTTSDPFVGYFHFLPPHEPYRTRHEFINIFKDGWTPPAKPTSPFSQGHSQEYLNNKRREYDEYIAYADAEFGRLVDFMEAKGILDNTYLFLTSDHGEMFERGILEHITPTIYEPIARVPLVIYAPGQKNRIDIQSPTSATDILPTIHYLAGKSTAINVEPVSEGIVLPGIATQTQSANSETIETTDSQRNVFVVEAKSNPKNAPLRIGTIALLKGRYKLVQYFGYPELEGADIRETYELYDILNDPEEMEDISTTEPDLAQDMQKELQNQLQKWQS